jgi:hypothetical protein
VTVTNTETGLTALNASGVRRASAGFIESTSTRARQVQFGLRFDW